MFARKHLQGRSIAIVEKLAALSIAAFFLLSPLNSANADHLEYDIKIGENTPIVVCLRAVALNSGEFLNNEPGSLKIKVFKYIKNGVNQPDIADYKSEVRVVYMEQKFADSSCVKIHTFDSSSNVSHVAIQIQGKYKQDYVHASKDGEAIRVPQNDNSKGTAGTLIIPMRFDAFPRAGFLKGASENSDEQEFSPSAGATN